ncbi:MAG: alpha/beta fold hydrolase [Janthinobacterium lividum]
MTNFVLCHGGGMGGWIWKYVAPQLRAAGHEVYTPTFTGFGERVHLLRADVTPETHVQDLVNTLQYNDLTDAIFVAHSYAGAIMPGLFAASPDRIRRFVFIDAAVLGSGEAVAAAMGMMPAEQATAIAGAVKAGHAPPGSGVHLQQREMAKTHPFRMDAERQTWLLDHLSDMPLASVVEPIQVGAESITVPVDYIAVSDTIMKPLHAKAAALGWTMHEIDGDHAIIVGDPEPIVSLLLAMA